MLGLRKKMPLLYKGVWEMASRSCSYENECPRGSGQQSQKGVTPFRSAHTRAGLIATSFPQPRVHCVAELESCVILQLDSACHRERTKPDNFYFTVSCFRGMSRTGAESLPPEPRV